MARETVLEEVSSPTVRLGQCHTVVAALPPIRRHFSYLLSAENADQCPGTGLPGTCPSLEALSADSCFCAEGWKS